LGAAGRHREAVAALAHAVDIFDNVDPPAAARARKAMARAAAA